MKNIKLLLLAGAWGLFALTANAQAALNFDGVNDYVVLPTSIGSNFSANQITLESWFNPTTTNAQPIMLVGESYNGDANIRFAIWVEGTALMGGFFNGSFVNASTTFSLNQWQHVACTYDQTSIKLYLNGTLAATTASTAALPNGNEEWRIGRRWDLPNYFQGGIDEVRIWNTARTAAQISDNRNCELLGGETGLKAYYRFNQSSGTSLPDISGNGNNGTLTNFALTGSTSNWVATGGVATGTTCTPGAALSFDGVNDYVSIPYSAALNASAFSFQTWVKVKGGQGAYRAIISSRAIDGSLKGYILYAGDNNKWQFWTGTNGAVFNILSTNVNVVLNQWVNLAGTYDGTTMKLYVNGTLAGSLATSTFTPTASPTPLRIGAGDGATVGYFANSEIDEVSIWDAARTQAQIQASMNCELFGSETGLKAYYKFNQSSGTSLPDASGNGNNGTLTNFALAGSTSNWVAPGGVTTGTICAGAALNLDGTDDYVDCGTAFGNLGTGDFTIEAWFKTTATGAQVPLVTKRGSGCAHSSFWELIMSNGQLVLQVEQDAGGTNLSGVTSPLTYNNNVWHHVAATRSGTSLKMYVDGALVATTTTGGVANISNATSLKIGNSPCGFFGGNMDEVRIWNTARTLNQILGTMNCELAGTQANLLAYYKFNQSSGTSLPDASGNGNNGTLANFALTGTTSNWVATGGVTPGANCLFATISGNIPACGPTTFTASGGSTYVWSTGATTASIDVTTTGTYSVTATAANGATTTASQTVTIYTPPTASISGTATACDQVSLTAAGGVTYNWSNGQNTAATTFTASATYTVTATDANGCTATASQPVTVNKATATLTGPATACDEAELTATGGIAYAWTDGGSGATKSYTAPGTYTVTATDANGCTATDAHTVFIVQQSKIYYLDTDGDGYGDSNNPNPSCDPLPGYILLGGDCNDSNPLINPAAAETCDNIDNNCNGILIETACGGGTEVSSACAARSTVEVLQGKVFFNYGSTTDARNGATRSSHTIGQPSIGMVLGDDLNVGFGFWTRFLLAPSAPIVRATEGDLFDRIEISWSPNPLSPAASAYNLYRDGSLLATVDNDIFAFIDFNVLAGQFYKYEVTGKNQFGEGERGSAPGFLNPNGVVTGQVKTFSGNPVPGAVVKLSPTLGAAMSFNGISTVFTEPVPQFPRSQFTLSCWVKQGNDNDGAGIFDLGSSIGKNWWLHTLPAGTEKGVTFGIGENPATKTEISFTYPDSTKNDWHNIAASYNGASLLLYVDGELVNTAVGGIEASDVALFIGKHDDEGGYFTGKIDELRFFDRQLPQTEIQMTMNQTVSASTPGLVSYWKFDEGSGSKAFDLSSRKTKAHLCGASWTTDKPTVVNAGISDETGFYKIEGVNYGPGTTFTARPDKNFYFNQSLEFNAANSTYAQLTNFDLADSSTVEITVKNFDFSANQCLLSKQNGSTYFFVLDLNEGDLRMLLGSTKHTFGPLGMGFHRLSFVIKQTGSSALVTYYKDGTLVGSHTFSGVAANFATGTPWTLGSMVKPLGIRGIYFTGLIDEVAFYSTLLPLNEIQLAANVGTNVTHPKLSSYFNLNEGSLTVLRDMGTALTGNGATFGATWSTVAAISQTLAHEFTPSSRLVTLNPSNTSADQIDFTDQSTIPVSGYVRFENTDCFQKGVEILVNGLSKVPQVFTDSDGKFIVDLEPGETVRLTPKFEQKDVQTGAVLGSHGFYPAFWDLTNVSSPVAGILFRNQTKRKVVGQMAGNETCRKSVIPAGAIVKVKVATLNGCYEQIKQLPANGKFVFDGVPPDSVTVSVIEHSNPIIYTFFQNKGGATLDLKNGNDTTDFIYLAPPQVELTPLDVNACGDPMLEMLAAGQTTIKVFEQYDGGVCYLDTALLTINNEIADLSQFDTLMTTGSLKHKFKAGKPNIVPPHLKTLQVTAKAHDELSTLTQSAVVLGKRARETQFASTSPSIPTLILRDPPGDASTAFMEKGETTCNSWSFSASSAIDESASLNVSLGPDLTTSAGFIAEVELEVDITTDIGFEHTGTFNSLVTNDMETCVTTTKVISTGDNDLIVGSSMGGDVYMGGAVNLIFGITDELIFDTTTCGYLLDRGLIIVPDGFATTFVYSEYHILTNVIPDLLFIGDTVSANRWQDIVNRNTLQKQQAIFAENFSFDGGVTYEQSETTETSQSTTFEFTQEFTNTFSGAYGVGVNGVGVVAGASIGWTIGSSKTNTNTNATSRTVGFTLADDDIGDNFTVNVKKDKVYGTPVFDLVSGQSQCPHEPNTQPREGVDLAADATVAVNVPMNDVAVFKLTLGNTSQSEEMKFYTLEGLQENNPHGAVIRFNGQPTLNVGVPFGQPVVVTMTVARGPVEFTYENLRIGYFSDCEVERADALGIDPPAEQNEEMEFDVFFLQPCSPINVGNPLPDWVHLSTSGTFMNITIDSYDKDDPDLELVRVQYRRSQGDGAWINIAELPKADLGAVFTLVPWNLPTSFKDGFYEIRAVTQCFSGALNPGISHVIKGKIERESPELFGTPEPVDGVYSSGDEISIRFNEDIRCDLLIQADVSSGNNNVGLYNTRTGKLVDAVISCSGDKITIVPNVPNQFLENDVLRVEVEGVKDLAGNELDDPVEWEFVNDRNNLNWVDNVPVYVAKYEEEIVTETRRLENRGGFNQDYEITGIPDWVRIYPKSGTLAPGQVQVISFEFDSTMVFGAFADTIVAEGALGDEPLEVKARVVCHEPAWVFDASSFTYSQNFILKLDIEGTLSVDEEDLVAAFVGDELRGRAKIQFIPALNQYLAFLTVYSNTLTSVPINFRIWDASACLLYGTVVESFNFEADGIVGSLATPTILHTNNLVLSEIPLKSGWNWISFNLNLPDNSINAALASMKHPQGDFMKSQTAFSQYVTGPNSWIGSLPTIDFKPMYQLRAILPDTIKMLGNPMDPTTVDIPLTAGWNWIGYLPQSAMPVNEALASLTPLNGDLLKSQFSFAQYLAGFGWIGNLQYMKPPEGYLLKLAAPGTLTYPHGGNLTDETVDLRNDETVVFRDSTGPGWMVNPANFESTMTIIGFLKGENGQDLTADGQVLGAFAGDELRGAATSMWIESLQKRLFFLTIYANGSGEPLKFRLFDPASGETKKLNETEFFTTDAALGMVETPKPFTLETSSAIGETDDEAARFEVFPNPFTERVVIQFSMKKSETVRLVVTDALGRQVDEMPFDSRPGLNALTWNGSSATGERLAAGLYVIRLETGDGSMNRKVIFQH